MIPGEMFCEPGDLEINVGRKTLRVKVANTGDRPIQVGSHYHFFETNQALRFERAPSKGFRLNIAAGTAVRFERAASRGYRLNIPAGTAVRFEPGQEREVELVALAGERVVYGFVGAVMGKLE